MPATGFSNANIKQLAPGSPSNQVAHHFWASSKTRLIQVVLTLTTSTAGADGKYPFSVGWEAIRIRGSKLEDEQPLPKGKDRYWSDQLKSISKELSRLAIACDIDIGQPNVTRRILDNDQSVCRKRNPAAFKKIRTHLMALYPLEERAIERLGADETKMIVDEIWAQIVKLRSEGRS